MKKDNAGSHDQNMIGTCYISSVRDDKDPCN